MSFRSHLLHLLSALCVLFIANPVSYGVTWTTIDYPNSLDTGLNGINSSGVMTGIYIDPNDFSIHGFTLNAGTYSDISYPGSSDTQAYGLNDAGDVVGFYSDGTTVHGFLYRAQAFTTIDYPGATSTIIVGINDSGVIAGYATDQQGTIHGFTLSGGIYTNLASNAQPTGINNLGDIVGVGIDGQGNPVSFILTQGHSYRIQDQDQNITRTQAFGVNDDRKIVGNLLTRKGGELGFALVRSKYSPFSFPGASSTLAYGVNNLQQIVGSYVDSSGIQHGFLVGP